MIRSQSPGQGGPWSCPSVTSPAWEPLAPSRLQKANLSEHLTARNQGLPGRKAMFAQLSFLEMLCLLIRVMLTSRSNFCFLELCRTSCLGLELTNWGGGANQEQNNKCTKSRATLRGGIRRMWPLEETGHSTFEGWAPAWLPQEQGSGRLPGRRFW